MKRLISKHLMDWANSPQRKPLLLRGARQVGKTYEVRNLGTTFRHFVEINFEKNIEAKKLFDKDLDASRIVRDIELLLQVKIIPGETLLFFDEIQEVPQAIIALRYFFEDLPKLHVVAAGSLLEFALQQVGVPVGRVSFLHMYPLSFMEFLHATGREIAEQAILSHPIAEPMTDIIHNQLMSYLGEYFAIGGMPEVVSTWKETGDPHTIQDIHQSLLAAYRQDFHKYAAQHQMKYVSLLFDQIPYHLGKTFKFSSIPGEYRKRELSPCLDLLEMAGIINKVFHSSAQGLPLGGQANLEKFKVLFLDIGLAQTFLGANIADWFLNPQQSYINKGEITEAFVGQELLAYAPPNQKHSLYYWHREKQGSLAEVDYVVQNKNAVIPIEVKGGMGNTLRSLYSFLESHPNSTYGLRFSTQNYSIFNNVHSYPLYAVASAVS